jgi:type IV secretion system protein TrbD
MQNDELGTRGGEGGIHHSSFIIQHFREEMVDSSLRRLVLHPSLIRPNLLAGGERGLVIVLWTTVFALIFGAGVSWLSIAVGMALGIGGQYGLIQAAKADPHWFAVYQRHLQYHDYYPAHSSARAESVEVKPSIKT